MTFEPVVYKIWQALLLFIFLFSCDIKLVVQAKVVRGHLLTGENWKFLSRFCFLSNHGKFEYDITYDASYGVLNLDLYYDTASQWARVYGDRADLTSCRQKESVLKVRYAQWNENISRVALSLCVWILKVS